MRSKTAKRDAKSLGLGLLMASVLVTAALVVINSALQAQTAQSSSSEKPKTTPAPADKPASAGAASTSSASTTSNSATPASPTTTSKIPSSKTQTSSAAAKTEKPAESATSIVWVNTASGVYHKSGTRWYGKTKKGKYMLEEDAIKAGYKPAK